jgi:hypothetical protein
MLQQRNLIYRAITRAKKLVILVGNKKALATAEKNAKMPRRLLVVRIDSGIEATTQLGIDSFNTCRWHRVSPGVTM